MKLIRSNKKGFGIHSAFVYRLVTSVLFPQANFYIFDEIDALKTDSDEKDSIKLIFRLLNYFQPNEILYCGKPENNELMILKKSDSNLVINEMKSVSDFQGKESVFQTAAFTVFSENIFQNEILFPENNSIWFIKKVNKKEELNRFFQTLLKTESSNITIQLKSGAIVIFDKKFHNQNYVIK